MTNAAEAEQAGLKVLVIDDSNTIRRSAEIFLKQGGYEVLLAEDGFDALSKVNDHDPDLIFCDILMPRLDGYQTCAIIKRNVKFQTRADHHAVVQGRPVRQGARPHGRLRGLPDQAVHEGPAADGGATAHTGRGRAPALTPTRTHVEAEDNMPIQKILLVDDSKTELHYMSELLGKSGFSVRTAENGEEAMKRLGEDKPDLILMDVVMPGQNGFQLTRAITRDPRFSNVPVIMCTSKNQETDKVWGMRQGARDYIVKPVDPTELMAKIHAVRLSPGPAESAPNKQALRDSRAGCAERLQAARTEPLAPVLAGGRVQLARLSAFRCARRARSSPSRRWCRCRTATAGSSASPTCAAICTASSTWPAFSASRPPMRRATRRAWSASTSRSTSTACCWSIGCRACAARKS